MWKVQKIAIKNRENLEKLVKTDVRFVKIVKNHRKWVKIVKNLSKVTNKGWKMYNNWVKFYIEEGKKCRKMDKNNGEMLKNYLKYA